MIFEQMLKPWPKYNINLTEIALQSVTTQRYQSFFTLLIDDQNQKHSIDIIAMRNTFLYKLDE
jgi:hypothetical protein